MADVRGLPSFPERGPARSARMGCPPKTRAKKGPLAGASGPSLGRKRPRRAAGTRNDRVAALQQYATAPHKRQDPIPAAPCVGAPAMQNGHSLRLADPSPARGSLALLAIRAPGLGADPGCRPVRASIVGEAAQDPVR